MLASIVSVPALRAVETDEASYPLLVDLADAAGNYDDAELLGNPTPPAAPNQGVCTNGVYLNDTDGQDVRTPALTGLDTTDFQLDVDFILSPLPQEDGMPVVMGGFSYRWIGIFPEEVANGGWVGVKNDNSERVSSEDAAVTGE